MHPVDSLGLAGCHPAPGGRSAKDEVVVEASAACDTHDVVAPGSFSWHVLTALADDVQTFHDGRQPDVAGSVFGITLTARRAASSR